LRQHVYIIGKTGVGKTTLVYHVAYMLSRLGYPTLAVDLDPQANLTSAFFDESTLEKLWDKDEATILACVNPILQGVGDIQPPVPFPIGGNQPPFLFPTGESLSLIAGDLGLLQGVGEGCAGHLVGADVGPGDLGLVGAQVEAHPAQLRGSRAHQVQNQVGGGGGRILYEPPDARVGHDSEYSGEPPRVGGRPAGNQGFGRSRHKR